MAIKPISNMSIGDVISHAVRDFVSVRHWGDYHFVNLPIVMPSGSQATVRVWRTANGFKVDDGGFAYRQLESIGSERSFAKVAGAVASESGVACDRRTIFYDCNEDDLAVAIQLIALASRDVAERVYSKQAAVEDNEIEDFLRERVSRLFPNVEFGESIKGSSTSDWNMSAVVHRDSGLVVFQAVGSHANSVYRTSAAFHDLAELPKPPVRIAVVKDRGAMGSKLGVLAQAGRIIELDREDETYLLAAEAA